MQRAIILRTARWILCAVLLAGAAIFLVRAFAQASLDGVPATAMQWFSWRSLFHLGTAAAALSLAAAAFLLIRTPPSRGRIVVGIVLVLAAPLCWIMPRVGYFVQADPCHNLGRAPDGQADSCNR